MLHPFIYKISGSSVILNVLNKYPNLTENIYSWLKPSRKKLSVNQNTQIVIEGFPRSANTFSVVVFRMTQTDEVNIAHHLHVPAQIIKGAQLKIPIIVLIRPPKDTVISLIIREPKWTIELALKAYINFYKTIEEFDDYYIVASFEQVTQDYGSVIRRLNEKFGTNFVAYTPQENEVNKIIERMKNNAAKRKATDLQISLPTEAKKPQQEILKREIENERYKKSLTIASNIYEKFILKSRNQT